jgi:tetratricopeptide (TPR) repeat protein
MPRALTSTTAVLAGAALLSTLTACRPGKSGTESASATSTATAGASAEAGKSVTITTASNEARDLYLKGRALGENLRAHDGRKMFEQAVAKDPSFAMAHYQLALNSPTAKDFFDHLNEAIKLSDKATEGERLMIRIAEAGANAQPKKGLELSQELVAKFPGDERAHFLLAGAWFGQQDYEKAIAEYQKAIEINPGFAPAYNLIGYANRPLKRYDEAEQAFKKYIELIPNDPNPYDSYAELLMKTGRFDESIAQYRKALTVDANFSPSKVGTASNLMFQGKPDEAAAVMQKLYDSARDDADRRTALFTRSVIFTDAGRTAAAVKEIEKEYALDAQLGDTANMSGDAQLMGNILLDAWKTDEAAKKFELANQLVQKSSLSSEVKADIALADHLNKGRVALAKGDVATAKTEAAAYMSGSEERHNAFRVRQAHQLAGMISLKEKDYDGAITHFAEANQQDPEVLYQTALAYKGKGDAAKAKEWAAQAADANILPQITYAFVRAKAKKMSA